MHWLLDDNHSCLCGHHRVDSALHVTMAVHATPFPLLRLHARLSLSEDGISMHPKVVREFQGGLVRDHYKDLKHACLILFNKNVDGLRKGNLGGISFVDAVLEASNVIEETTLMREQIKSDEAAFKRDVI